MIRTLCCALSLLAASVSAATPAGDVNAFISELTAKGHDRAQLEQLLLNRAPNQTILSAISKPAEGKPWHQYHPIFLTQKRIDGGLAFWRAHRDTLEQAEQRYGVPAKVIVAIIGVETSYGQNMGKFSVLDALYTLGFHYPKRADFFRSELGHFFELAREEGWEVTKPKGSYAGAMGMGQFIPSSYRHYAVDFDGDQHRDLFRNTKDAIGSVANYFAMHKWHKGAPVTSQVRVKGDVSALIERNLELTQTAGQLRAAGVEIQPMVADDAKVRLMAFDLADGSKEYWVALNNFYVITRYNRSPLYAMAVYQLSEAIAEQMSRE